MTSLDKAGVAVLGTALLGVCVEVSDDGNAIDCLVIMGIDDWSSQGICGVVAQSADLRWGFSVGARESFLCGNADVNNQNQENRRDQINVGESEFVFPSYKTRPVCLPPATLQPIAVQKAVEGRRLVHFVVNFD